MILFYKKVNEVKININLKFVRPVISKKHKTSVLKR